MWSIHHKQSSSDTGYLTSIGKEEFFLDKRTAANLRQMYPNYIPLKAASELLGVSLRQLSRLIAEGREPYCLLGGNIGTRQRYVRIYTERLIAYLNGYSLEG